MCHVLLFNFILVQLLEDLCLKVVYIYVSFLNDLQDICLIFRFCTSFVKKYFNFILVQLLENLCFSLFCYVIQLVCLLFTFVLLYFSRLSWVMFIILYVYIYYFIFCVWYFVLHDFCMFSFVIVSYS